MKNTLTVSIAEQSELFFEQWKYLLFQEKCRLCKRILHPFVAGMNMSRYAIPAVYSCNGRQIGSDVLCKLCLPKVLDGQAVVHAHQFKCANKSYPLLVSSASLFQEPMSNLILRLKYGGDVLLAKDMACILLRAWNSLEEKWYELAEPDSICLVPVPLHSKRMHERGYNQAELITKNLSRLLNLAVESKLLKRVRNTDPQQKLGKAERLLNVRDAFRAKSDCAFLGKHVVLIDDVCTSGATLVECSKAVKAAGAAGVYGLTVAFVF